jgi:thiamine biosynthesis protein ThiS
MKILINGEGVECGAVRTVDELVLHHRLGLETTLVELNGTALHRREWSTQVLQENDRIEILRVAAGG